MMTYLKAAAVAAAAVIVTGCAIVSPTNPQSTSAQADLSQANFTVVQTGVKGTAEATYLGIRCPMSGEPFGIVLTGAGDLTTQAMNDLREKAGLKGKSRVLVNVTQELEYKPWVIIWHRVQRTITADVIEFNK